MSHKDVIQKSMQQVNNSYTFLQEFELTKLLHDKSVSKQSIQDVIDTSINNHEFRSIIELGIKQYCKINKESEMMSNILKSFHSKNIICTPKLLTNNLETNPTNISSEISNLNNDFHYCHSSLKIQTIICKIFEYLDFQSLIKCSKVNSSFLFDSYQPLSIYSLNTENLYSITWKNKSSFRSERNGFGWVSVSDHFKEATKVLLCKNILRFRNVSSIIIRTWPPFLNQYLEPLGLWSKITQICIHHDNYSNMILSIENSNYSDIFCKIIDNNYQQLKKLKLYWYCNKENKLSTCALSIIDKLNTLTFNNLKYLVFYNHSLYKFPQCPQLISLVLKHCYTCVNFWKSLIDSNNNRLSIGRINITSC